MKRIILLLLLQNFAAAQLQCQTFTVHDLVSLANSTTNNIGSFMKKNGFVPDRDNPGLDTLDGSFIPKHKPGKVYMGPQISVDLYHKPDSKYFILHTPSLADFQSGKQSLVKAHFIYDNSRDINKDTPLLFQKENMSIEAIKEVHDSTVAYLFRLKAKNIPDSIAFAEDLLQFDSHEFLSSYFGAKNVKKDSYYFSETELKKCSVLFAGTKHQALFVWGDENNFTNLSYILVSSVLPTKGAQQSGALLENNEWRFQNGIHSGMPIKDILRLNEMDFDIYGNKSDFAFMIKATGKGKINFNKTAVMLTCSDCFGNDMFDHKEVSALDVAKANFHLHVLDIIIYP